jgi:trans-aconitate 2-methyltransferase
MTTDIWNAQQYLKFEDDRLRPFLDLVAQMDADELRVATVVDLGCGPGNATAMLADWWPEARITGIDSSQAMIDTATAAHTVPGRLEFELGDIRDWQPEEPVDVVLANAVLQWIPEHLDLIPKIAARVADGGLFGFQVPGNFDAPSHRILNGLRTSDAWRDKLSRSVERAGSSQPGDYLRALASAGLEPNVWESTYLQIVPCDPATDVPSGVTDFVSGTALRPLVTSLSKEDGEQFVREYDALVRDAYPVQTVKGRTVQILPYRRIFAVGQK